MRIELLVGADEFWQRMRDEAARVSAREPVDAETSPPVSTKGVGT